MTELAKAYDPSAIEDKWAQYWVEEHLFDVSDAAADSKPFTMLLPPPNVTGFLHMGHMFEHAESDILVRWHRMKGERALWIPGTDHAGIATQMLVERQLASEGTSREQLGREAFTARVWAWKQQYGGAITTQMRRLGTSVDWSREYFTMDERLSIAVVEAFVRLHEQGLIYRGAYIVNWDPVLQTAVSDLEVESTESMGKLYSIQYPLADGSGSITIATTRPETMLGDTAVAVNPNDERYRHYVGRMLHLPLTGRQIPIVADNWANPEFGTGAVKVTPAHDPNDFALGQRHDLASINIFDKAARIDLPGSEYHGLGRFEARKRIVEDLRAHGLLVAEVDHPMALPISQRTGEIIEPRLSVQWFLKIQPLADKAIAAVDEGHIKIIPEMYGKTYSEWMSNIHDWCISRQLWWGHRIPAWHCGACKAITVARTAPSACATCNSVDLTQETDVLDTWFSSGLLPFTVFGWPGGQGSGLSGQGSEVQGSGIRARGSERQDLAAASLLNPEPWSLIPDYSFYPTDLLVTGFDILFFWVARMIMLGTHFMLDVPLPDGSKRTLADAVPFRTVYIHALIRDANREKMSKTKGNVVDPIAIINRFGTDAVRFTLASMASPGTDIAFSEERTDGYRAFANKIWNAARFLFMNLDRAGESGIALPSLSASAFAMTIESRWILSRLALTATEVDRSLTTYRFDEAANAIYRFFWSEMCDWYLELAKLRLNFDETANRSETAATLETLVTVFEAALRLLSPFMPFITEEIWHALYAKLHTPVPARSISLTRYPQSADYPADAAAEHDLNLLQELIVATRSQRKDMAIPEKEAAPIRIFSPDATVTTLAVANADMLARMARVTSVAIAGTPLTGNGARSTPRFDIEVLYERTMSAEDVEAEKARLTRDLAKYEKGLAAAEKQLSNEGFMARAPEHIVAGLRKQLAETRVLYERTKSALGAL